MLEKRLLGLTLEYMAICEAEGEDVAAGVLGSERADHIAREYGRVLREFLAEIPDPGVPQTKSARGTLLDVSGER